ncbi:MAG: barstar family protein [Nocardioidaceae bacterium]
MSGLAALLAGRTPPGAYRWHSHAHTVDVRHAAGVAGWSFAVVDTSSSDDVDSGWDALARALQLPDWFGRNLDALNDVLASTGESALIPLDRPILLWWEGWSSLAQAEPSWFGQVVTVVGAAASTGVALVLRGDGPDPGVLDLDRPRH